MGQFDKFIKPDENGDVVGQVSQAPGGRRELSVPGVGPKIAIESANPAALDKEAAERQSTGKNYSELTFMHKVRTSIRDRSRVAATKKADKADADAVRAEEAKKAVEEQHKENLGTTTMRMGKFGRHAYDPEDTLRTARERGYTPVDTSTAETIESSVGIKPDTYRKNRNEQRRKDIADAFEAPDLATTTMRLDHNGNPYDTEDADHGPRPLTMAEREANSGGPLAEMPDPYEPKGPVTDAEIYDKEGNVRPEFNDIDNNPLGTTTMRLIEHDEDNVPTRRSKKKAALDVIGRGKKKPDIKINGQTIPGGREAPAAVVTRGEAIDVGSPLRPVKNIKEEVYQSASGNMATDEDTYEAPVSGAQAKLAENSKQATEGTPEGLKDEGGNDVKPSVAPKVPSAGYTYATHHETDLDDEGKPRELTSEEKETRMEEANTAAGLADDWKSRQLNSQKGRDKAPKSWDEQNLWDKEGNLKPEYNDIDNNPLATTTMRMRDKAPLFRSPLHKKAFKAREKAFMALQTKHNEELAGADSMSDEEWVSTKERHDSERAQLAALHPEPKGGYYNTDEQVEMAPTDTNKVTGAKPQLKSKQFRSSAKNIINWPTTNDQDEDRTIEDLENEDERKRARLGEIENSAGVTVYTTASNVGGHRGTRELDLNRETAAARPGRTAESALIGDARLQERVNNGGSTDTFMTLHKPEVMDRAKRLVMKLNPDVEKSEMDHPDHPLFSRSKYVAMASIMHEAGVPEDREGTADYQHLLKHTGTNESNFENTLETDREAIENQERFKAGKQTTYSVNPEKGEEPIDINKHFFRDKAGNKVPLSNMTHPENPLKNGGKLVGSESPFMGFHGDSLSEEGIRPTARGLVGKTPDWVHEGWHPYKDEKGDTVFEHHSVKGATHLADFIKHAISKGRGINAMTSSLKRGANIKFKAGQDAPVTDISAGGDEAREHDQHVAGSIYNGNCSECLKNSSKMSKARAAAKAAEFATKSEAITTANLEAGPEGEKTAPLAMPTSATTTSIMRNGKIDEVTDAERAGVDKVRDSRTEGQFAEVRNASDLRKLYGNGKGLNATKSDILEAVKNKKISHDEAYELAISSGHIDPSKSKFKDEE